MIESSPLCPNLNSNLRDIKRALTKEDWDCVCANTGPEGNGKSNLSLYMAASVDENFTVKQIVDSQREFEDISDNLDPGQAVVADEGVHWLFNRNWNTPESRIAIGDLMVIRQKRLFIIVNIYNLRYIDVYLREGRLKFATQVKTFTKYVMDDGVKYATRGRGIFNLFSRRSIVNHFDPLKSYALKPAFQEWFPALKDLEGGKELWTEYKKKKDLIVKNRPRIRDFQKGGETNKDDIRKMTKKELINLAQDSMLAKNINGIS